MTINSSNKPSIFVALSCFALFALTGCTKDPIAPPVEPNPPVAIEKKILDFYIPFKNVVINEQKHQIIIYETEDLEEVTPTIEVSSGVTIQPASGVKIDESKPVTYTLTASDGSTITYTLIVCTVDWEYLETVSGGFSITRMGHFEEPWTATSQNGIVTIHFGSNTESAVDIFIKTAVSPALASQFLVGNYTLANVPAGKAGATFTYRENGSVNTFFSPLGGSILITEYNAVKGTISGNFGQIKYAGSSISSQGNTILSGTFEDLPLEIK